MAFVHAFDSVEVPPNRFCDVHHVREWINDGETSLANSALLCERDHTKVHHGFRVQRDDGAPPGRDGAPGDPTTPRS